MLLGKYYISQHALEQYDERVDYRGDIIKSIKRDLKTLNIRHIIRTDCTIYVFTKNSKEFIFKKTRKGVLCLKTIIRRNREDTLKTVEKRKALTTI